MKKNKTMSDITNFRNTDTQIDIQIDNIEDQLSRMHDHVNINYEIESIVIDDYTYSQKSCVIIGEICKFLTFPIWFPIYFLTKR